MLAELPGLRADRRRRVSPGSLRRSGSTACAGRRARAELGRHRRARPAPGLRPAPPRPLGLGIEPSRGRSPRIERGPAGGFEVRDRDRARAVAVRRTSWWPRAPGPTQVARAGRGPAARAAADAAHHRHLPDRRPCWTPTGRWSATPPTATTGSPRARTSCARRPTRRRAIRATPDPRRPTSRSAIERVNDDDHARPAERAHGVGGPADLRPRPGAGVRRGSRGARPVVVGRPGRLRHPDGTGDGRCCSPRRWRAQRCRPRCSPQASAPTALSPARFSA